MRTPRRPTRSAVLTGAAVTIGLVAYTAAVYVVVVVLINAIVPVAPRAQLGLTCVAAALVAFTLEPMSRQLRSWLSLAGPDWMLPLTTTGTGSDDLGGRMEQLTRLLADTFGRGATARVQAELGADLTATWQWPPAGLRPQPAAMTVLRPLVRSERRLGELTVDLDEDRELTPIELRLLDDAADHAALIIEGARMDQTLQKLVADSDARNAKLQRSRARILTTMEDERRRLERDIHDGAQQHLVALAVNLRLLRVLLTRDPARARITVGAVRAALLNAVQTLERLSVGLYPSELAEAGPAAALRLAADASPIPVIVHADVRRRLPTAVERTAYFSCLEAMQNAIKHADAQRIVVTLTQAADVLAFEVADDGRGFDPTLTPPGSGRINLADRVSGAGGQLTVSSAPGRGTTVSGWIPAVEVPTLSPVG